jgi:hypothetical protein
MTKDDIIKLAREAGFERVVAIHPDGSKTVTVAPVPELEAFAKLVAAAEREQCAKVCEEHQFSSIGLAAAIRTRGNT